MNNLPDPGFLHANGTWFAYDKHAAINDTQVPHVPVVTSTDFKN